MGKYCHDSGIHMRLVECEGCSAYYDDKESENCLVTEKDQRNFIEEEIRADERKKVVDLIDTMDFDFGYYYDFTDEIKKMIRTALTKENKNV